jgi:hypothetical protein
VPVIIPHSEVVLGQGDVLVARDLGRHDGYGPVRLGGGVPELLQAVDPGRCLDVTLAASLHPPNKSEHQRKVDNLCGTSEAHLRKDHNVCERRGCNESTSKEEQDRDEQRTPDALHHELGSRHFGRQTTRT